MYKYKQDPELEALLQRTYHSELFQTNIIYAKQRVKWQLWNSQDEESVPFAQRISTNNKRFWDYE